MDAAASCCSGATPRVAEAEGAPARCSEGALRALALPRKLSLLRSGSPPSTLR